MSEPWRTATDLAKAIREARGTMSQDALAKWLGIDKKTVIRWEAANEASLGKTKEKRRATAILVAEATGRRDLLLSEPAEGSADLEKRLDELDQMLWDLAARALDEDGLVAFGKAHPSDPHSEEEDPGGANG